jgi:hypothetical protein
MNAFRTTLLATTVATLALASACTVGDMSAPRVVEINAASMAKLAPGQSLDLDLSQPATFVFDGEQGAIDYRRINLLAPGAEPMTMVDFVDGVAEMYGPAYAAAAAQHLELDSSAILGAMNDGTIERKVISCSDDGKLCFICYYDDHSGDWIQCDVIVRSGNGGVRY